MWPFGCTQHHYEDKEFTGQMKVERDTVERMTSLGPVKRTTYDLKAQYEKTCVHDGCRKRKKYWETLKSFKNRENVKAYFGMVDLE